MPTEKHAFAALKRRLPQAYLVRIENSVGVGLPDVYGAYRGTSFWVELKMKNGLLSTAQHAVCRKLVNNGVPVYLAFYDGRRLAVHKYTHDESTMECRLPGESLA
jgi:hypothetical protein